MSNAFMFRMPSGIPGAVSREENKTIESVPFDSSKPFSAYGLPGKIVSGKFVPLEASDTAAVVYGFLARPYPTNSGTDGLGVSTPPTSGFANVLRRGYMTVANRAGTPALNGPVYTRVATPSGAKTIGDVEAVADSTNTVVLNATFMGSADAASNAEIAYNI